MQEWFPLFIQLNFAEYRKISKRKKKRHFYFKCIIRNRGDVLPITHFSQINSKFNAKNFNLFWFSIYRFINARRRIVQPMIDQSNRAGKLWFYYVLLTRHTCFYYHWSQVFQRLYFQCHWINVDLFKAI